MNNNVVHLPKKQRSTKRGAIAMPTAKVYDVPHYFIPNDGVRYEVSRIFNRVDGILRQLREERLTLSKIAPKEDVERYMSSVRLKVDSAVYTDYLLAAILIRAVRAPKSFSVWVDERDPSIVVELKNKTKGENLAVVRKRME